MSEASNCARRLRDKAIFCMVLGWIYIRYIPEILRFRHRLAYLPNAATPRTLNEKFLWRKIFDHSPLIGRLTDKLEAKAYFAKECPSLAQAELIWIGEDVSALPQSALAGDVVVKSNCGSGQNVFSYAGQQNHQETRDRVRRWIERRRPYGKSGLEWGYSQVRRKVLVERLIRDEFGNPPINVNVHACDGEVVIAHVWRHLTEAAERHAPDLTAVYDCDRKRLAAAPLRKGEPNPTFPDDFQPPASMALAYQYAKSLSRGIDFVRVDFLCTPNEVFAGEMTFYSHAGYLQWNDRFLQEEISRMWDLRKSWFLTSPQPGWRGIYAGALRRLFGEGAGAPSFGNTEPLSIPALTKQVSADS